MKVKLRYLFLVLAILGASCPFYGQTAGFHRLGQVLARAPGGVAAQVVPNAKINVTDPATGLGATIYSDANLTVLISPPLLTADFSGQYDYYVPANYCVNENISSPGQGSQTIQNICQSTSASRAAGINTQIQFNNAGSLGGSQATLDAAGHFFTPTTIQAAGGTMTGTLNGTSANFSSIVASASTLPTAPAFAFLGDSLTNGGQGLGPAGSPPGFLSRMIGQPITNLGYSGFLSTNLAAIIGALPMTTVGSGTIPACAYAGACTQVALTLTPNPIPGINGASFVNSVYVTIDGVTGYYYYSSADVAYYFVPVMTTGSVAFTAGDAATVVPNYLANSYILADIGRNDIFAGGNGCPTITTNLAAIASQATKGYMFGAILNANSPSEFSGQANYTTLVNCNAALKAIYAPNHWVGGSGDDLRKALVNVACSQPQADVISASDCAHDEPPTFMRARLANVIAGATMGPSDTTISLATKSGAVTGTGSESGEVLVIDTGVNAEGILINSCTGTSSSLSCSVTRGLMGTATTHVSGTSGVAYSGIHMGGLAQNQNVPPWMTGVPICSQNGSVFCYNDGYYTMAQAWANSLYPPTAPTGTVGTLLDVRSMFQQQGQPKSHYDGQANGLAGSSFFFTQYPWFDSHFQQENDGKGSIGTSSNLLCENCLLQSIGSIASSSWNAWSAANLQKVVVSNTLNTTGYFAITGNQGSNVPTVPVNLGLNPFMNPGNTTTATTTNGSNVITVASNQGIVVNDTVTGTGIPAGDTVTVVSGTTITLLVAATADGAGVSVLFKNPNTPVLMFGFGDFASGNQSLISSLFRDPGFCTGTTMCSLGLAHKAFPVYVVGAAVDASDLLTSNVAAGGASNHQLPATVGTLQLMATTPHFGGVQYNTAANATDQSGVAEVAPNTTTTPKCLQEVGNGSAATTVSWVSCTAFMPITWTTTASVSAPTTNNTYYVGLGGIGTTATIGNVAPFIPPAAGTLTAVNFYVFVGASKGTVTVDNLTCSIWDSTASAIVTGATASVPTTAATNIITVTGLTGTITAGHQYVAKCVTPASWTTQPTSIEPTAQAFIQ